jgi:hypothetical protein
MEEQGGGIMNDRERLKVLRMYAGTLRKPLYGMPFEDATMLNRARNSAYRAADGLVAGITEREAPALLERRAFTGIYRGGNHDV